MRLFTCLLICFLIYSFSYAQIDVISFTQENNGHIYVKAKINNLDQPLNFVLDTGATANLLDSETAKKLNLEANSSQSVMGANGAKSYEYLTGQNISLSDKITVENTDFVLANVSHIGKKTGQKVDGIIGYSLLKKYITAIDFDTKRLLFYSAIEDAELENYKSIPFEINWITIPQFTIAITLKNGKTLQGRILLDTGAALTLSINTPFVEKNQIEKQAGKVLTSRSTGLNTTSIRKRIAIDSLQIADFSLNNIPIGLSQRTSGVSSFDDYLGILGSKIISKFNIILDYDTNTLYLKPNKNYDTAFAFPLTGIRLKYSDKKVIVDYVDNSTPAYKNGIREGDHFIAINGKKTNTLQEYREQFKKEGTKVTLEVLSENGNIKTIQFPLKKLL